jgi:hypothetical protein
MEMENPFRTIRMLADWLADRDATRQDRKLRQLCAPQVAKAEKAKDWNKRDELLNEWQFESQTVLDPVYARKADRLTAKVRKYGITVVVRQNVGLRPRLIYARTFKPKTKACPGCNPGAFYIISGLPLTLVRIAL